MGVSGTGEHPLNHGSLLSTPLFWTGTGQKMSFMFGLEKGESEAAGCFSCLVCAAESLAKTSDLVTIELAEELALNSVVAQ